MAVRGGRNLWGTCVWLPVLSTAFFCLTQSEEEEFLIFNADSTLRPISPLSGQSGFVCGGYTVGCALCSIQMGGRRMADCGDQIKGKKQGFTAFFYLNRFYHFIVLFHSRVSRDLSSPIQKPSHHFCLRGRKDIRESPEPLRSDLGFLFILMPMKIVFSWLCLSAGS